MELKYNTVGERVAVTQAPSLTCEKLRDGIGFKRGVEFNRREATGRHALNPKVASIVGRKAEMDASAQFRPK